MDVGRTFVVAGPRHRHHHYTANVPYSVPVYSPNIPALTSALSNALTTQWVKEFERELKATITKLTQEVAENATKHINDSWHPQCHNCSWRWTKDKKSCRKVRKPWNNLKDGRDSLRKPKKLLTKLNSYFCIFTVGLTLWLLTRYLNTCT